MTGSFLRYYMRKEIVLHCETVTPLFLGNARQDAEWRSAPFKALLRYWWRVTQHDQTNAKTLLREESNLFGSAGEKEGEDAGKSFVNVRVFSEAKPIVDRFKRNLKNISHPETKQTEVKPLLYLAGMGLMSTDETPKHSYFPAKSSFEFFIDYPSKIENDLQPTFAAIQAFGSLGARSRKGWGSFQIDPELVSKEAAIRSLGDCTKEWKTGFEKDYPNCLGRDRGKLLLWKTEIQKDGWEKVMRELADVYVSVRAKEVAGISKLDPDGEDYPSERHLLGFPLTHHPARKKWRNTARHGSPLRFVVKEKPNGFQGLILHLPHRFSDEMEPMTKEKQMEVWDKVHQKFDKVLTRAQYEDCL